MLHMQLCERGISIIRLLQKKKVRPKIAQLVSGRARESCSPLGHIAGEKAQLVRNGGCWYLLRSCVWVASWKYIEGRGNGSPLNSRESLSPYRSCEQRGSSGSRPEVGPEAIYSTGICPPHHLPHLPLTPRACISLELPRK